MNAQQLISEIKSWLLWVIDFGLIVLGRVVYSPASAYDLAAVDEIVN